MGLPGTAPEHTDLVRLEHFDDALDDSGWKRDLDHPHDRSEVASFRQQAAHRKSKGDLCQAILRAGRSDMVAHAYLWASHPGARPPPSMRRRSRDRLSA